VSSGNPTLSDWLSAFRLRTLPLALSSILAGAAAAGMGSSENYSLLALAMLTTILLQILSNISNDYGDSIHGADNNGRIGPVRAVQSGRIRPQAMKSAMVIFALLALLSGICLLIKAFGGVNLNFLLFLGAGILAIISAIRYTAGPKPYGYRGFGDLSVFLFFGIIGVCGTAFLLSGEWKIQSLLPAAGIGLLSASVLHINNMRDRENDKASNKITLAVRLGAKQSKMYHICLVLSAWMTLIAFLSLHGFGTGHLFLVIPLLVQLGNLSRVWNAHKDASLDKELPKMALSTFSISLTLFLVDVFGN
jgi:1,4-dihydroxy-2-naphthoate octaprenyltransferase